MAQCRRPDRLCYARFRVVITVKRCFSRYTQRLKTVFLAHAWAEHDFARQLAEFLEFGCNLTCYVEDGLIGGEQDLISMAEEGLSADVDAVPERARAGP